MAKILNFSLFNVNAMVYMKTILTKTLEDRASETPQINHQDLLQLLMDARDKYGARLHLNEVIDQGIYLMIAGSETVASTLASAAYCLALNPKSQDKLIHEIYSVLEFEEDLSFDRLNQMDFLNAVVWEVLRCLPPIPRIERKASRDCMLGNIFVAKDTLIIIPVYAIHRDPENFEEPEEFRPERFTHNRVSSVAPFSLLPFGAGPRSCLGLEFALYEIKLCLVTILQKFRFEVCPDTEIPLDYVVGQMTVTPKNVVLRLVKR
jgi:cytochrome P450 family 3 subfamily A